MKINFAVWDTCKSGGTRFIFETANILVKRGHEVIITSLGSQNHFWFDIDKRIRFIYPEFCISIPGKGKKPFIVVRDDYNSHGEYLVYAI